MPHDPAAMPDEEERAYLRAVSRYKVRHMSNAKWRRVLTALAAVDPRPRVVEWRMIDCDHVFPFGFPHARDLLERRFADGMMQPFEYRWIESIRVPARYFSKSHGLTLGQDLTGVRAALAGCGPLAVTDDDAGVTLHAYGR